MTTIIFSLIGVGLFCGLVFPCLDGPANILKYLRLFIGKPFSCPVCSALWGILITAAASPVIPEVCYVSVGAVGWCLLIMHISGFLVFYEGMENE